MLGRCLDEGPTKAILLVVKDSITHLGLTIPSRSHSSNLEARKDIVATLNLLYTILSLKTRLVLAPRAYVPSHFPLSTTTQFFPLYVFHEPKRLCCKETYFSGFIDASAELAFHTHAPCEDCAG